MLHKKNNQRRERTVEKSDSAGIPAVPTAQFQNINDDDRLRP